MALPSVTVTELPMEAVFEPEKNEDRVETPSTVSGDDEEVAHLSTGIALYSAAPDLYRRKVITSGNVLMPKRGKGLSSSEFLSAVKAPFLFPSIRINRAASKPMCIICNKTLLPGNVCRELVGCGHCFHSQCVDIYFASHSRCPVCRARCRGVVCRRHVSNRPCWTPDYDAELLLISDEFDKQRRGGGPPHSGVFLNSTLPTLLEESPEVLETDGSLLALCQFLNREKEKRVLRSISLWTRDMRKVATSFCISLIHTYLSQQKYMCELSRIYSLKRYYFSKN